MNPLFCLVSSGCTYASPPPVPYPIALDAGSAAEQAAMIENQGSAIVNGARMADAGQSWVYGFAVNPGETCLLTLIVDGNAAGPPPQISIVGVDGKPLPSMSTHPSGQLLDVIVRVGATERAPSRTCSATRSIPSVKSPAHPCMEDKSA